MTGGRFVAPSLRDPRVTLLVALSSYTVLGQLVFFFNRTPLQLALTLGTCILLDLAWTAAETGKIVVPLSGAITGLSLGCFLRAITGRCSWSPRPGRSSPST